MGTPANPVHSRTPAPAPRPVPVRERPWRILLLIVLMFSVVSCAAGGIPMVVWPGGEWIDPEAIRDTPFDSYLVPGLLLLFIGALHLWAFVALLRRAAFWRLACAVAGFAMTIWILVEILMYPEYNILQPLYGLIGLAEIGLLLAMLGVFERR
ncbi:hypothetical protein [uncultured Corynebacterium sp.]|uniref:hypothetical protein n=1 Tax=uncultured Corynebacterium sp. TaxID=159447 RepID=UPI00260351FA|nr:hypothetical protein [uncultured Corynebacterium sp.]